MTIIAITGATGFVGQEVMDQFSGKGITVRALARKLQPSRAGVEWVAGALDDPAALDALCAGADAVLHIAGAVNVPTRADFAAANIAGTEAILAAAKSAGVGRFVHVSSLAAREPALSNYGWSKAGAEDAVRAAAIPWTIVRPPAVYGPRDADMLDVFAMARRGLMLLPPAGRTSLIHVTDLAALLITLTTTNDFPASTLFEPDDGTPGGLSHHALGAAIGAAVGKPNGWRISVPAWVLRIAAAGDRLVRGSHAKLTPDRASYMAHPDWVADPAKRPPPSLWSPGIPLETGLRATAIWYSQAGWFG